MGLYLYIAQVDLEGSSRVGSLYMNDVYAYDVGII